MEKEVNEDVAWFRWDNNSRHNRKIRALPADGRWFYVALCEMASQLNLQGVVHLVPGVKYSDDQLADEAKIPTETVRHLLELMESVQLVEERDDCLFVTSFAERQYQSDSSTPRTQAFRERSKKRSANADKTPSDTDADTEADNTPYNPPSGGGYPPRFEEFWAIYPRRANKAGGYEKWRGLRRDGIHSQRFIRCAQNYADACKRKNTEEQYILHAATFLGPKERWKEYEEPIAVDRVDFTPATQAYTGTNASLLDEIDRLRPKGGVN